MFMGTFIAPMTFLFCFSANASLASLTVGTLVAVAPLQQHFFSGATTGDMNYVCINSILYQNCRIKHHLSGGLQ